MNCGAFENLREFENNMDDIKKYLNSTENSSSNLLIEALDLASGQLTFQKPRINFEVNVQIHARPKSAIAKYDLKPEADVRSIVTSHTKLPHKRSAWKRIKKAVKKFNPIRLFKRTGTTSGRPEIKSYDVKTNEPSDDKSKVLSSETVVCQKIEEPMNSISAGLDRAENGPEPVNANCGNIYENKAEIKSEVDNVNSIGSFSNELSPIQGENTEGPVLERVVTPGYSIWKRLGRATKRLFTIKKIRKKSAENQLQTVGIAENTPQIMTSVNEMHKPAQDSLIEMEIVHAVVLDSNELVSARSVPTSTTLKNLQSFEDDVQTTCVVKNLPPARSPSPNVTSVSLDKVDSQYTLLDKSLRTNDLSSIVDNQLNDEWNPYARQTTRDRRPRDVAIHDPLNTRNCARLCDEVIRKSFIIYPRKSKSFVKMFRYFLMKNCKGIFDDFCVDPNAGRDTVLKYNCEPWIYSKDCSCNSVPETRATIIRKRSTGICRFIAEMFLVNIFTVNDIAKCAENVMQRCDPKTISYLFELFDVSGRIISKTSNAETVEVFGKIFEKLEWFGKTNQGRIPAETKREIEKLLLWKKYFRLTNVGLTQPTVQKNRRRTHVSSGDGSNGIPAPRNMTNEQPDQNISGPYTVPDGKK